MAGAVSAALFWLAFSLGCGTVPTDPVLPAAPAVIVAPLAVGEGVVDDAHALYEGCRDRVEGLEKDDECTSDADCATGGCSSEICATPESLKGMMSTCEILPCFSVLRSCGCVQGRCSWTVGPPDNSKAPPILPRPR